MDAEKEAETVTAALGRIPLLADLDLGGVAWTRLGGLTNLVYRLEAGGETYVLRIPGEGTEDYIDRAVEAHNARVAAEAGVSAELLFADAADGLLLMRHLDGTTTMTPESFRETPGAPARAARAFKQLHDCGQAFEFRFELFAMIDDPPGEQHPQVRPHRMPRGIRSLGHLLCRHGLLRHQEHEVRSQQGRRGCR